MDKQLEKYIFCSKFMIELYYKNSGISKSYFVRDAIN